jgi:hypothetical protein
MSEETTVLTRSERANIPREFPEHLARMRDCLQSVGRTTSGDDITLAWARYSDDVCASWLEPSNDADALRVILLR